MFLHVKQSRHEHKPQTQHELRTLAADKFLVGKMAYTLYLPYSIPENQERRGKKPLRFVVGLQRT